MANCSKVPSKFKRNQPCSKIQTSNSETPALPVCMSRSSAINVRYHTPRLCRIAVFKYKPSFPPSLASLGMFVDSVECRCRRGVAPFRLTIPLSLFGFDTKSFHTPHQDYEKTFINNFHLSCLVTAATGLHQIPLTLRKPPTPTPRPVFSVCARTYASKLSRSHFWVASQVRRK